MRHNRTMPTTEIHRVNPDLAPLLCALGDLHPDPQNARAHDARDIAAIAASYTTHGQQKPIVALVDGTVIAGNGQLEAARQLGWTHIAVVRFADVDGARAFALADNRTAELSTWNDPVLAKQLEELAAAGALDGTGFTLEEMMRLTADAAAMVEATGADPRPQPPTPQTGGIPVDNTSHVRMVQLFLNDTNLDGFMVKVKQLAVAYGVDNITDAVMRAVEREHDALTPKTPTA